MKSSIYNALMALFVTFVVAGTGALVWLWAAPQWDAYRAETQMVSTTTSEASSASSLESSQAMSEAHSYNASLAGENASSTTTYANQLKGMPNDAISWLYIPSINVRRPVYHYDNETVLMSGLGHVEGTSLPVGGASTHCCVTGHSGMIGSRMFDDLHEMVIGDVFVFWTLGNPYAYKVYSIEVVEPDDTSSLQIQPGRDLATLITCTPYGINSHRLLVHGERTEYVPEEMTLTQHPVSDRLWVLAAGMIAAGVGVALLLYMLLGGSTLQLTTVASGSAGIMWQGGGAISQMGSEVAKSGALRIELKPFGRTEVSVSDATFKTRWHRVGDEIIVNLHQGGIVEQLHSNAGEIMNVQIPEEIRLRKVDGSYVAEAIVNNNLGTLTFES